MLIRNRLVIPDFVHDQGYYVNIQATSLSLVCYMCDSELNPISYKTFRFKRKINKCFLEVALMLMIDRHNNVCADSL